MGPGEGGSERTKHGVTFAEACTVFDDVDHLVNLDPASAARFIAWASPAQRVSSSSSTSSAVSACASSRRAVLL
jgi:uncharacterized DUF497 family protein